VFKEMVKDAEIVPELKALFERWKATRIGTERFGDWSARVLWPEIESAAAEASSSTAPAPLAPVAA
jgi:sulfite reductase (NADPH) hemoprotein beta-component